MAHRFPDGSWGARVQPPRRFKQNPKPIDLVVGDGRFGYRIRPTRDSMVTVEDYRGEAFNKSRRRTVARRRKHVSRLATRLECAPMPPPRKSARRWRARGGRPGLSAA